MLEEDALVALERDHKRAVADVVVTMHAIGWVHGWMLGFAAGVGCTVTGYWLLAYAGWL